MEFVVRRATVTHLLVRGESKAVVMVKSPTERVRVVQSASPIPATVGVPIEIDGGNF